MKVSTRSAEQDQADARPREVLSESLIAMKDLQSICEIALEKVLEASDRSAGLIQIITNQPNSPYLTIDQKLNKDWSRQIADPNSVLHLWARYVTETGEATPVEKPDDNLTTPKNLAAALPIKSDTEVLGVIMIQGKPLESLKIADLEDLISPISRALLSQHILRDVQERTGELANLQTELTDLGFSTDIEALQARMLKGAFRVLDAKTGALILLDEDNVEWMMRKSLGDGNEWAYQINPIVGSGLVRTCLQSGKVVLSDDPINDPRFDPSSDSLGDIELNSMICTPLIVDGQVLGAIQVVNKRSGKPFNHFDQDLISIIAALAANAMQGTRLIQKLKVANADLEASRWELLGSRNTLRALFDNLPTALYIIDPNYTIMAINQRRAQIAGQSPKTLVGKTCYQALFNRPTACPECRVQETFVEKIRTQRQDNRQVKDETTNWEINSYPIIEEEGKVVQAILLEQDITEQQRLEGILAQSEKLAAIGQLAAGVAHEINNPLTAIIANAQILHRELPAESDLQESVDLIARAGARATQVVRNLLDFARKEDYHLGLTNINESLQRSLELMQHEILARSVKVTYDLDPNLPPLLASQDHLQSVWLNLVLNALDALDKSPGSIKISTRRVSDEIHISVADNGKGIAPERLTRIFEPFYTTKEPGRGTGLGLSVCHRIVKQHNGHIRVESQVGAGSEFTIILPQT